MLGGATLWELLDKRVAETPATQQIKDPTGSGPFIFDKAQWQPGHRAVFLKNPDYQPRPEPASSLFVPLCTRNAMSWNRIRIFEPST